MRVHIEHQTTYSRIELLARSFFGFFYIFIPHMFLMFFYSLYVMLLQVYAWFHILFTEKYPLVSFNAALGLMNWQLRVNSSMSNLVDGYPEFGPFVDRTGKVFFDVAHPEIVTRKRLLFITFFGALIVIPQLLVVFARMFVGYFMQIVAWFSVLFTGNYPESFHKFQRETQQLNYRISSYISYFYFSYPEFTGEVTEIDQAHVQKA